MVTAALVNYYYPFHPQTSESRTLCLLLLLRPRSLAVSAPNLAGSQHPPWADALHISSRNTECGSSGCRGKRQNLTLSLTFSPSPKQRIRDPSSHHLNLARVHTASQLESPDPHLLHPSKTNESGTKAGQGGERTSEARRFLETQRKKTNPVRKKAMKMESVKTS